MNPNAFGPQQSWHPPVNRAEARAREQFQARSERAARRSRARIQRALQQYPREGQS